MIHTIAIAILMAMNHMVVSPTVPTRTMQDQQLKQDHRMNWWRDARFGMFIHWGLYSIPAGKWGTATHHGEWIRETAHIPVSEYEKLLSQFNPVKFDAKEWVRMAKDAGMKYIVITSKHHDGFALFDSKYSDWDVMSTPFKRDIMKELSAACADANMKMCWYHSIMDWHHPDYLPRRTWEVKDRPAEGANFDRFVKYLHNQVSELLTNYGPIGIMWFDGEWESTWNHGYGQPLYDLCRKLQPNVIVNNRVDVGRGGMAGMSDAGFAGDYGTPEQEIPATGIPGVDWETCMTMNRNWGYNAYDKDFKSTESLIHMLCDIASKGGNFLLNIGPTSDGLFPQESIDRLKDIGTWMKVNSESIYGTSASPFKSLAFGRCTQKSNGKGTTLYLQVFDWPKDGTLRVPGIGNQVVQASVLGRGRVKSMRKDGDIEISGLGAPPSKWCSVIQLDVVGKPIIYDAPEFEIDSPQFVTSTSVKLKGAGELDVHYTIDGSEPTQKSPKFVGSVHVAKSCTLRARSYHGGKPVSGVVRLSLEKVTPSPAAQVGGTVQGLDLFLFNGDFNKCEDFARQIPTSTRTSPKVGIDDDPKRENCARVFEGYLQVDESEMYVFSLRSDDGSRLFVDEKLLIDNDGLHSPMEKRGHAALAKGLHKIRVEWFNKTGGADLKLSFARMGKVLMEAGGAAFRRRPDENK